MVESKHSELADLTNERLIDTLRRAIAGESEDRSPSELREEIVNRNIGLVKSIALKFRNSGELLDDLIQAGYIGLLNAVSNFDLARSNRFSTYASYLIQGEIRHYIRDKHSTIRIPQWVQTMNRRIKEAEEDIFQQQGRPPTLSELAAKVELREEQVRMLLRGRESMVYVSIDQDRRSGDPNPTLPTTERLIAESNGLSFDIRMRILAAIEQLTDIQQGIVQGLFYQGKSQSEVGKEMGISQRQVSRMKESILSELREAYQPEDVN
ncbi:sigma-70 family RNA polymerase sigma factor [Candidatus Bipolaricaulota bacterium]|nr:sigma-70 family RNA polymerase sigma factor [Candidatus Bipolaricaulota bacterium]MCK5584664.1 sigma-70 family RNA polymerase sigma factor [Candidatus Bipolaricaulota bacterium]